MQNFGNFVNGLLIVIESVLINCFVKTA